MDAKTLLDSLRAKQRLINTWGTSGTIGQQAAKAMAIDFGYLDELLSDRSWKENNPLPADWMQGHWG